MTDLSVLPAADEVVRCAPFARRLQIDPGGSAISTDLLIGVEVSLPWPKPVFDHETLAGIADIVADAPMPTKVLALVPAHEGRRSIVAYRRGNVPAETTRREWTFAPDEACAVVKALVAGQEPEGPGVALVPDPDGDHRREVWLCTQGSHDLCCGSEGMRLALAAAGCWDDVTIRRVSHTGGHRFAPTGMTLPDGRMWADLDIEMLESIFTETAETVELEAGCRGWWGAAAGAAQVAERAIWAREGWGFEALPRSVSPVPDARRAIASAPEGIRTFVVEWARTGEAPRRAEVDVVVSRDVPTIACRAPGGLPTKPGCEYRVLAIRD